MDWINRVGEFADKYVREIRLSSYVIASVGFIIIIRRTHALTLFGSVKEIPQEFITKHISFRVRVLQVKEDASIVGSHVPILVPKGWIRKLFPGTGDGALNITLSGVEGRKGIVPYIENAALGKEVKVVPYSKIGEEYIGCVIYTRKKLGKFLPYYTNLNKELVAKGVAVVVHDDKATMDEEYDKITGKLLRTEIVAERKGVGIWKREPLLKRLSVRASTLATSIKNYVLFWRK